MYRCMMQMLILMFMFAIPALAQDRCFFNPEQAYAYLKQQNKININTAAVPELMALSGIGQKTAEAIVVHRQQFGAFLHVDDLLKVKGIGAKTLEKNRHKITVQ